MDKAYLVEIAKASIYSQFVGKEIDKALLLKQYPALKEEVAVFVTLRKEGELRGCIGSLQAHQNLLDDLIKNAKAAAFQDPRFKPLTKKEFDVLEVEVALLTEPQELIYRDREDLKKKVEPKRHGVILRLGNHQATFLPQVWEQLPSFELFFEHLCKKAGVDREHCLEKHPEIFLYEVEKVE